MQILERRRHVRHRLQFLRIVCGSAESGAEFMHLFASLDLESLGVLTYDVVAQSMS